jgi:ABC-type Fe3+-hydroxamate transport system substrate-binding protein
VRIVSLLSSVTETVCLPGLEEQLVGVSADSSWPTEVVERLPVLNTVSIDTRGLTSREIDQAAGHRGASLYHVHAELLRRLQPDAGDTHLFSRSGPRLVDGVEILARMLHPEVSSRRLQPARR